MSDGVMIALISTAGVVLAAGIPSWLSYLSGRRTEAGVGRIDRAVNQTGPKVPPIKEHAQTAAVQSTETNRRMLKVETDVAVAGEHAQEARRLAGLALAGVNQLDEKLDRALAPPED